MHKSLWMAKDGRYITNGEMGYENSSRIEPKRSHEWFANATEPELFSNKKQAIETVSSGLVSGIEPKRSHQWFMDATEPEIFSNKKQAIEAVSSGLVSGISDINISPWQNATSFQSVSGQFTDRLFGSEPIQSVNLVDRNVPSVDGENISIGRKDFEHQYGDGSSGDLSMSRAIEDASSCLTFGGIRKVKVNEVRDSNGAMSGSLEHSYSRGDNCTISMGTPYNRSDYDTISLGPAYGNGNENSISIGPTFTKENDNFISVGHTFNKEDRSFMSVGHNYNKGNENFLSINQSFDKENGSFMSMGQSYVKGDGSIISLSPSYNKVNENLISVASAYRKPNESSISMAPPYEKGEDNIISYDKTVSPNQDRGDYSILSIGHDYNNNGPNTISFGGFHDEAETNPSGSIICDYNLLVNNQNEAQASEVPGQKELIEAKSDTNVGGDPKINSKAHSNSKNKELKTAKKASTNNFPSNVKSLLSTGMLDGVAVKYVSWSREKNLKGYIKGTGYMCGCNDCKFEKALNAYEFERHANCKTKHPNNHIYFENGKTIYGVVQELKSTPQEMLFDAIQNVTGSQINQKNFNIWKASYQAATRELQRIYGTDDVKLPC